MSIVGVDALVTNLLKIATPVFQALRDAYKDMRLVEDAKEALAIGSRQLADTGYRHRSLHPSFIDRKIHLTIY